MLPNQQPPPGWPRPARTVRGAVSAGFMVLISAFLALTTVLAAASGDIRYALGFGVVAVLVGLLAAVTITRLRPPRPAGGPPATGVNDRGEAGIAFPYSRLRSNLITAVFVVLTLGCAGFAVAAALEHTAAGWVLAAAGAVLTILFGWLTAIMVRLMPGVIVLTDGGIEYFVPWDAVVQVIARGGATPALTVKAMPSHNARERRYTGGTGEAKALPFLVANAYLLGANAVPAYTAVTYYLQSPAERHRLAAIAASSGH
jgi:hypothetical protein